ncbi:MAG: 7-cyano-7-deazaguanine synthase QueC [Bacteroidota bacterium]
MKRQVIVLLSGGMDSVTALYHAREQHEVIGAISFDYGSKHNHQEIPFAKWHCEQIGIPHQTVKATFIEELFESSLLKGGEEIPEGHYADEVMKKTVVPFRNGIMLSIACGYAESIGATGVVIAAHSGDHAIYPDCRTDFMMAMGKAMQLGTYADVELLAPFVNIDKTEIAKIGTKLGVDYGQTWSCYKGRERHCGKCGTCYERKEAFALAGIADPTEYDPE